MSATSVVAPGRHQVTYPRPKIDMKRPRSEGGAMSPMDPAPIAMTDDEPAA